MVSKIDIHGHYTSAPPQLDAFRGRQLGEVNKSRKKNLGIDDEEIVASLAANLAAMDARGIDLVLFSPRASGMGHDYGDARISRIWTEVNNDLIHRVRGLFPNRFAPVCQLPQSPGSPPQEWLDELDRCVLELGFVGCNINPDISGGLTPLTPSLADPYWYPLWQRMVELRVPGMIHASSTHVPGMHVNGAHYLAWDHAAVVELTASAVFDEFPDLRLVIPHGGGATAFHFNRHRSLHRAEGLPPFEQAVRNLHFDTSVYDGDSIGMLVRKIGARNILFGTEMFGTARGDDPETGSPFDDVGRLIDGLAELTAQDRDLVLFENALRIYPRLADHPAVRGSEGATA
ncbi:amidohydrolase family protein [Nocardia miyunensis]|uniref:amidohydrolase family protein n=1 Tax=Nocardia miyunensis TaxID=282684 RepID=UPI00082CBFFE|nr:amidohydrolase family protein [Nocardia miyunensis]